MENNRNENVLSYDTYPVNNWKIFRLKDISSQIGGTGFPENLQGMSEGDVEFFKVSDINGKSIYSQNPKNFVNRNTILDKRWNIVKRETIIFPKVGESLRKNHRKILTNDSMIDNNIGGLAFESNFISKFSYYLLSTINMDWFVNGGAVPAVNMRNLKFYIVNTPEKKEQLAIARFLDSKTSAIGNKISILERRKKLIQELEKSVINQAVTKGVESFTQKDKEGNPVDFENNAGRTDEEFSEYMLENGFKDSGGGIIHKKWEVTKFSNIVKYTFTGTTPIQKPEFYDGDVTWITIRDLKSKYVSSGVRNISNNFLNRHPQRITKKGDLLFSFKLSVGKVSFSLNDLVTNEAILTIPKNDKKYSLDYFYYSLPVYIVKNASENIYGAKMLNQNLINTATIVKITIEEQLKIAKFLEIKTKQFSEQTAKIDKEIELLKEFQKSLINDVVTGKIKVIKD